MLPIFGCLRGTQQIGYLVGPTHCGPTAFWDFYSPLLGELGQPNLIRIKLGFKSSFPQFLHSHIHTYAVTHNRFLLEVFEGLVTPDWSKLLKGISGLIIGGCVIRKLE